MTVTELIDGLKEIPGETAVCLSKIMLLTEKEAFEVILDQPIHGIAHNAPDNELRFVVYEKDGKDAYQLAAFGKEVRRLE